MEGMCDQHSGIIAEIAGIKEVNRAQWTKVKIQEERINTIMTRINVILGGLVIAILMMVLNLVLASN